MATAIQQRLLDLAADIATSPPDDLAFTHSVLAQTSLPTTRPPEGMRRWERRQGRATLLVQAGEAIDPRTQRFIKLPLWSVMLRFGEPGLASEGAAWLRASAAVLLRGAFSEVEGHQILDVGIWRAQR